MIGFTEEPELKEIIKAAHDAGVIVVDDLGSGALIETSQFGLAHEPTVQEALADGADLVCFSGDKLLGGPQAGIILGRSDLLTRINKHPLTRALRVDKTCLAGITATILHYLKDEAVREIPIWRMIAMPIADVKTRAEHWAHELGFGDVIESESTVGGGSLPGESLQSYVLSLDVKKPDKFLEKLRKQNPPIIARTADDKVLLDPRTVLIEQDLSLLSSLHSILSERK